MTSHLKRSLAYAAALLFAVFALAFTSGCTSYPDCDDDEICQEDGKREYCVNGTCRQCRDDSHCAGLCGICDGGQCGRVAGCCESNSDCSPDLPRCVDNQCDVECNTDNDCADGFRCDENKCVKEDECNDQKPCPNGYVCKNLKCEKVIHCQMEMIYFDFDESSIRNDAKAPLQVNASCFEDRSGKGQISSIKLVGHCDERGTEEYNMVLGEKRSKAAMKAMGRLGVSKSAMSSDSRGEYELAVPNASSESQHQRNRRVVFTVQ